MIAKCGNIYMRHQRAGLFYWPSRRQPNTSYIWTRSLALDRVDGNVPALVSQPAASVIQSGVFCIMGTCRLCGEYAYAIRTYDGIRGYVCYTCQSARATRKARESNKRHREGNKLRRQIIRERGYYCESCGCSEGEIHMHHKVRLMDGGKHTRNNVKLLCKECHQEAHKDGTRW